VTTTAPLWQSQFTVQHRIWGLRSLFAGIADEFRDATGLRRGPAARRRGAVGALGGKAGGRRTARESKGQHESRVIHRPTMAARSSTGNATLSTGSAKLNRRCCVSLPHLQHLLVAVTSEGLMRRALIPGAVALSCVVTLLPLACGTEPTDPSLGSLSPSVVSGDGQQGAVGTKLTSALVVRAVDTRGRPIRRLGVHWQVTSGGGHPDVDLNQTDQNGYAFNYWTLGTSTADSQRLEARVAATNELLGAFRATASPGPATQVAMSAGDTQTVVRGTRLPIAPAVRVSDQYGNPVILVTVTFAIGSGGGSVTGATATSVEGGIATVGSWTLGATPGVNTLTATASGLAGSPVTFTATGTASAVSAARTTVAAAPATVAASTGDHASVISITARDDGGFPVAGATVTLAATGTGNALAQPNAPTDANGVATGSLSATSAGSKTISATVKGVAVTQTATVTVTSAAPAAIAKNAGDGQTAAVGAAVSTPPAVVVRDSFGNAVAGADVAFAVTAGGGSTSGTNPIATSSSGVAAIGGWTLGPTPGTNTLAATVSGTGITVSFTATGLGGSWTPQASLPTGRMFLAAAAVNGTVYAVGGADPNFHYLTTVEAYDPVADAWTSKSPLPTPRGSLGAGVINGVLYVVGGGDGGNLAAAVEAYDPATDSWSPRAAVPTPRADAAVTVVSGILYVIGGSACVPPSPGQSCGWVTVGTVEAYDPNTDTWTTKASMPTARWGLGAATVNGIVYAVGGQGSGSLLGLHAVEAYDPSSDSWSTRAPLPTARYSLGVGVIDGVLYAVGGDAYDNYNNRPTHVLEAYDPVTDAWTGRPSLPTGHSSFGASVVNRVLYAIGGNGSFNVVEAFRP